MTKYELLFQMPNKCPNVICSFTFDKRNQPETCPKCSAFLGKATGAAAKTKRPKTIPAPNPKHVTVDLGGGTYSVQYHQHNRSGYNSV